MATKPVETNEAEMRRIKTAKRVKKARTKKVLQAVVAISSIVLFFVAIMTFVVGDWDKTCVAVYAKTGIKLPSCAISTPEDAERTISDFFDRASGADFRRGWEMMTPDAQVRLSPSDFKELWEKTGWTELLEKPVELKNSANTFSVISRTYGSPKDRSDDSAGNVDTVYVDIQLKMLGNKWFVDRVAKGDISAPRKYSTYGIATFTEDQLTHRFPNVKSPTAWSGGKAGNTLPVFCRLVVPVAGANGSVWLRTSLGWIDASKSRLNANQAEECNPRYQVLSDEKYNQ